MARKTLKPGDAVSWNSSGGESVGKVVKKLTSPTQIKTHKVAASADNPNISFAPTSRADLQPISRKASSRAAKSRQGAA